VPHVMKRNERDQVTCHFVNPSRTRLVYGSRRSVNTCIMQRSTEAPMDFDFTSRPSSSIKPVWALKNEEPSTPRKRAFSFRLHQPST